MNKYLQICKQFITKHQQVILTGSIIVGAILTVPLTVNSTVKAVEIINEEETKLKRELTKKEIIKATWKEYIPVATSVTLTIIGIVCLTRNYRKKEAALLSAINLSDRAFREYKENIRNVLSKKENKNLKEKVDERIISSKDTNKDLIIDTGLGDTLCYDYFSGRLFKSDIEKIRQGINVANKNLNHDGSITLNDLYYEIGLESVHVGDLFEFQIEDGILEENFTSQLTLDGVPCLVVSFYNDPRFIGEGWC